MHIHKNPVIAANSELDLLHRLNDI